MRSYVYFLKYSKKWGVIFDDIDVVNMRLGFSPMEIYRFVLNDTGIGGSDRHLSNAGKLSRETCTSPPKCLCLFSGSI